MRRTQYELPLVSQSYRDQFPMLAGLKAFTVEESTFFGWVGCSLKRITWHNGDYELRVFTAATWGECTAYLDELMVEA